MKTDLNTYARKGLEAELARLDGERERVRTLLASLDGTTSKPLSGRPAGQRRGQMSAAGRQAIREAQKRRWARVRKEAAAAGQVPGQDSESGSSKIAADGSSSRKLRRALRAGNRKK